jgi:uncharacterized protein involved in cysteine biosynthesis
MSALEKATGGWSGGVPDWVQTLAEQCDATSQNKVAKVLGYSAATVSLVLAGSYSGDLRRVELAVRGAFLAATVNCPVLGDIPANDCLTHQRQDFRATNHVRVQLYRACHGGCSHASSNLKARKEGHDE